MTWPVFAGAGAGAPVGVVVIDGRGHGHGVGMAQEGAFSMASAGASTEAILGQFYPGTTIGKGRGHVRVPVLDAGAAPAAAVLGFPNGGELREGSGDGPPAAGFPVKIAPGGAARITWDGERYRIDIAAPAGGTTAASFGRDDFGIPKSSRPKLRLISYTRAQVPTLPPPPSSTTTTTTTATTEPQTTTTTTAPAVTTSSSTTTTMAATTAPTTTTTTTTTTNEPPTNTTTRTVIATTSDNGTIVVPARQRRYRGTVEATAGSGTLRLVNDLDVEDYLKGMGEVRDPSWPPAALRAQAIAARTYALRAMAKGGELCDTQRCQVYLGAQAEYPQMNAAVAATNQKVLAYGNAFASAVYSANAGGYSATREEGFGTPPTDNDYPYLRAAPYPSRDQAPWQVTVALADVASRLGYAAGQLQNVTVTRTGPSGRALEVTLDGTRGPKPVTGIAFDTALGLRSALFTARIDVGEAPPPPPPSAADAELQAPPDEAAALASTEVAVADDMAAADELYAAAGAAPPTKAGRNDDIDPRIAVLAAWAATAGLGAAMVAISGRRRRRRTTQGTNPTHDPSPSAPPAADDSA